MRLYWLGDENFPGGIQNRPGVYTLHVRTKIGNFKQLPRLLGRDPEGILFIGQSRNLRRRLQTFKRVVTGNKRGHSEAMTYRWIPALKKVFPLDRLFVSVRYAADPETAEQRCIERYARQFGEVPPLNLNTGGRN